MSAMGPLAEQAIRLLRRKWTEKDVEILAQELFLILEQDTVPATGPGTVTNDQGEPLQSFPDINPFDPFQLPDLSFPDLTPDQPAFDQNPANPNVRTRTQTMHRREVVPGVVEGGGNGDLYTVTLYPNGGDAADDQGNPVSVTVDNVPARGLLDTETIPPGTWVWVFRHQTVKAITTYNRRGANLTDVSTQYKLVGQSHEMVPPIWLNGP